MSSCWGLTRAAGKLHLSLSGTLQLATRLDMSRIHQVIYATAGGDWGLCMHSRAVAAGSIQAISVCRSEPGVTAGMLPLRLSWRILMACN